MAQSEIKMKMSLDGSGVQKTLKRTKASVQNFAKSGVASIARFGAAFAGIGLVKSIIGLGTAAAETASKFDAVFKGAAGRMNEEVQNLRKTIPATTAEMQGALATFAQMGKAFGLNSDAANLFSVEMVKIAGDIASFNDLPIEDAFTKIRSAISGEFEPMKQLGIVINEAMLKQEALNLAIWDGTGQMSAAQKALAVQSILIRDMGDANGDAALTADSAANRIKFLQKNLKEIGTEIGVTALPAILELAAGLAEFLKLTQKATNFVGTKVGEMFFGVTDETLAKRQKAISQYEAEKQAVRELTKEGKLYKQGLFEGTLWTKGLSEKLENNKRLIEERTKAILDSANATETSNRAETKANNESLRGAKDLTGELEKQIKNEKDPARKKALEERLAAYKALLVEAGKLQSLQPKITQHSKTQTAEAKKQAEAEAQKLKLLQQYHQLQRDIESMKVGSGGDAFEGLSTEKLNFLLSDTQKQFRKLDQSITRGSGWTSRKAIVQMAGGATLQTDINRIEKELAARRKFTSSSGAARSLQFDPFQQERLNRVTQGEQETTKLLRNISTDLKGINRTTSRLDSSLS